MNQRIAKVIAQNGHCSRRQAEALINEGKVFLNNHKVLECATFVKAGDTIRIDRKTIQVDFKSIASREIKLFMMNKPINTICTEIDEVDRQRQTVTSLIPKKLGRLIMIGRLDYNSEGLLLFTNDGHFAEFLMHPRTELKRLYKVRITSQLSDEDVKKLEIGLKIKHESYRPIKVIERKGKKEAKNSWVMLELTEGKNREIRKAMEHLGHEVSRLVRVAYADLALGAIPKGELVEIHPELYKELVEKFKEDKK